MRTRLNALRSALLLAGSLALAGCPMQTEYPLIPSTKAMDIPDLQMAGTWRAQDDSAEVAAVSFAAFGKGNYEVRIVEKGSASMTDATIFHGWTGRFEGMSLLVLEESDEAGLQGGKFYVYELQPNGPGTVRTRNISLLVGGSDAVTSTENYQKEVRASMKKPNFLANPLRWKKQ